MSTLFSSIRMEELVDGLHGLRLPYIVGLTIGYAFVLLYTGAADILRIEDAMKVKGLRLESRNPLTLFPALLCTIIRRANTMMAVLELRGFSATARVGGPPPYRWSGRTSCCSPAPEPSSR